MKIANAKFPLFYVITRWCSWFLRFLRATSQIAWPQAVFLLGYGLLQVSMAYCFSAHELCARVAMLTLLGGYYAATDGVFNGVGEPWITRAPALHRTACC